MQGKKTTVNKKNESIVGQFNGSYLLDCTENQSQFLVLNSNINTKAKRVPGVKLIRWEPAQPPLHG